MDKKIIISLHNGLGDLVMTFPFINILLKSQYEITFDTCSYNHDFLRYFFKDKLQYSTFNDTSWNKFYDPNYNIVCNLNRLYKLNETANNFKIERLRNVGIYPVILTLLLTYGIPESDCTPDNFNPGIFNIEKQKNNKLLLFFQSTAGNRALDTKIVEQLRLEFEKYENVIINPQFENKFILCEEINNAKFVLTMDSGPLHISEALKTPYHGLLTINDFNQFGIHYNYGVFTTSSVNCSPCNIHINKCIKFGDKNYVCQSGFDINYLKQLIYNNL